MNRVSVAMLVTLVAETPLLTAGTLGCFVSSSMNSPLFVGVSGSDFRPSASAPNLSGPSTITDLQAQLSSVNSSLLSWTAPHDDEANVSGYQIGWSTAGPIDAIAWVDANIVSKPIALPPGQPESYNLTGLPGGSDVWFAVRSYDDLGVFSNISNSPMVTMPTTPSAPRDLVAHPGNHNVSLSWQAPLNDGGAPVTSYSVYSSLASGSSVLIAEVQNASYVDTDLINGQDYDYWVTAKNALGESAISNVVSSTPLTVPRPPQDLAVVPGRSQARVQWQPPADDRGSAILSCNVYRIEGDGQETLIASVNGTELVDFGLVNGVTYRYSISAVSGLGEGERTNWTETVPGSTSVDVSVRCDASATTSGFGVVITGRATHLLGGDGIQSIDLVLYYSVDAGGAWNEIATVRTNATGGFYSWWTPSATGNYSVRAVWPGSQELEGSLGEVNLSVLSIRERYVLSVESNSTVSDLSFDSERMELGLTVSGPNGTTGYLRIAVSDELISRPDNIMITFDGSPVGYDLAEEPGTCVLTLSYQHSTHRVAASLEAALAVPSAPMGLAAFPGTDNITVTWTAPTFAGPGMLIYHMFRGGEIVWSGNNLMYVDSGLIAGRNYTYTVSASNDLGWGQNSSSVNATPLARDVLPGPPRSLQIRSGDGRVELTWKAPRQTGGGPITGYAIYRGTSPTRIAYVTTVNATSFTDMGLTNGQQYHYKVSAMSSVGEGPLTEEVATIPAATNPGDLSPIFALVAVAALAWMGAVLLWSRKRG